MSHSPDTTRQLSTLPPLTPTLLETIWWLSFTTISFLLGLGYGYRRIAISQHVKKTAQLVDLRRYRNRLANLTNEMLAQADDLDQKVKYSPDKASDAWSKDLGIICDQLVNVGETLPLIEELLDRKKVKEAREGILRSCRMLEKISRELHTIRDTAPKLLGDSNRDQRNRDKSG